MAIKTLTTIKATIQMRHGLEIDFDADQMAAGEWAVSTDKKYVRMCFAPGIVIRMATYEAFEQDMLEIQTILATCEDILAAVEAMVNLAEQHKNVASASASIASAKADDAANSASTAAQKANAAGESATNAANSASTATSKANAASASATSASNSATSADTYAKKAQSYAIGTGGVRPNESTDNAKYYYEQSKNISQGLGGTLLPMGTVSFANLPALSNAESGSMYNVSDQFTTTSDFNEGAGKVIPAGSNVYKTADGKWDVLAGTPVTTVNGQTGNVVLNKVDVGLGNVPNVTTNNQTPTFTQATTRGNISSGDKLSVIFGKIMKWFSDLKNVAFTGSYNDLSNKPSIPSITNDYLATQPGTAADAMLAKELRGDIDAINSKLGNLTFNTSLAGVKWTKLPNGIILGYGDKVVISGSDKYLASFAGYHGVESIDVSDIPFKTFKRVFGHIEGGTSWPMYLKSDCSISGNALFLSIMTDNPNSGWNFHYFIVGV